MDFAELNICNQVNVTQSFVDNGEGLNSVGEAQAFASKTAITALAFAKMGPGFTARLQGLLHGGEYKMMNAILGEFAMLLSGGDENLVADEDQRKRAGRLAGEHLNALDYLLSVANAGRETVLVMKNDVKADFDNPSALPMIDTLRRVSA